MKYLSLTVLLLLFFTPEICSQDPHAKMNQLAGQLDSLTQQTRQTSVYLVTSKEIYISGEDLWFSAFVLNATDFTFSAGDRTLYLQLQQTGNDSLVWQEMYPITNGLAAGHVYLPESLAKGSYLLKAFTAHSYFAEQSYFYAATQIEIVNAASQIRALKQPTSIQKTNAIQFSIFPEGGDLVAGIQNKVAFKAVNKSGDPIEINGTLLKDNAPILRFKSWHAGMGNFSFVPEAASSYQVRLQENDSLYLVPEIRKSGIVMSLLQNEEDTLTFKLYATTALQQNKFFLRLQIRGTVLSVAQGTVADSITVKIPVSGTSQGIAEATLYDQQLRPLASRLVYLHLHQQLNIDVKLAKDRYNHKEKIGLTVKTTNHTGQPVPAALNVRVADKLFSDPRHAGNIVSHYYLTTQLRGRIYDPAYYFNSYNENTKAAMDLLLLTQGWSRYTWNEDNIRTTLVQQSVASDSLESYILPVKKGVKKQAPMTLMLYNYNKSNMQMAVTDSSGKFYLTPENLALGNRFFIKYVSDKEFNVKVPAPFERINKAIQRKPSVNIFATTLLLPQPAEDTGFLQYGKTLKEITISAKGKEYSTPYLGYLDSIAKYEGNLDYVGKCGFLNCPDGRTDIKPVEGQTYFQFSDEIISHRLVLLTSTNYKKVVYHYPKYTEEELLKKFKIAMANGYYQSREFYEPNYDKDDPAMPDNRNTLAWKPAIITDQNGEATIEFYSSDVSGAFTGVIEGAADQGLLGSRRIYFSVSK